MILNQKKTKVMIFNFTDKYKFTTNLNLNDEKLEVVNQAKLLGVIISDDLKWDKDAEYLVKKAYSRMELLRKVAEFTKSIDDKREIYILYIRSILKHGINLRKNEKYEVKFAKTNRLKNSSVPYMQRIINTDNLKFDKQD